MRGLSYSRSVMAVHVPDANAGDAGMHSQGAPDKDGGGKTSPLQHVVSQPQVPLAANSRLQILQRKLACTLAISHLL